MISTRNAICNDEALNVRQCIHKLSKRHAKEFASVTFIVLGGQSLIVFLLSSTSSARCRNLWNVDAFGLALICPLLPAHTQMLRQ